MFDLNSQDFNNTGNVAIFNNGVAGKVENVSLTVEKRRADEPDNAPDYKVFFTDDSGAQINMGLYYFTKNELKDEAGNAMLEKINVQRAHSIAKSVLPKDFVYPVFANSKEAMDGLMKLTKENAEGKKVNVFATYGTKDKPKSFLGVYKNFDFIEAVDTVPSRLRQTINPNKPQYDDMMERIVEDKPVDSGIESTKKPESIWG